MVTEPSRIASAAFLSRLVMACLNSVGLTRMVPASSAMRTSTWMRATVGLLGLGGDLGQLRSRGQLLGLLGAAGRKGEGAADDLGAVLGGLEYVPGADPALLLRFTLVDVHLGQGDDRLQHVVELVGEPPGEGSHGGHPAGQPSWSSRERPFSRACAGGPRCASARASAARPRASAAPRTRRSPGPGRARRRPPRRTPSAGSSASCPAAPRPARSWRRRSPGGPWRRRR